MLTSKEDGGFDKRIVDKIINEKTIRREKRSGK
jgi:hypothetical protein